MFSELDKLILYYMRKNPVSVSSKKLSLFCDVSVNTIKNEIISLNNDLTEYGCKIESKKSLGYFLVISDQSKAETLFKSLRFDYKRNTYNKLLENYRMHYIIRKLLVTSNYITIEYLCDNLYCSRSTVIRNINEAKEYLKEYDLKIKNKNKFGFYIEGNEWQKRLCLIYQHKLFRRLDHNYQCYEPQFLNEFMMRQSYKHQIRQTIIQVLQEDPEYFISFIHLPKIVNYIILCVTRAEYTKNIQLTEEQMAIVQASTIYDLANKIVESLNKHYEIVLKEKDIYTLTMLLLVFRTVTKTNQIEGELCAYLKNEEYEIIAFISIKYPSIRLTDQEFLTDFCFRLYNLYYQNIANVPFDEEIITPIKNDGLFAVDFCVEVAEYFSQKKQIKLDENTILSMYFLFNTVLDKFFIKPEFKKISAIVVSVYGIDYAKNVAHRIRKFYNHYLEKIDAYEYVPYTNSIYNQYDVLITDNEFFDGQYLSARCLKINFLDNIHHNPILLDFFKTLDFNESLKQNIDDLLEQRVYKINARKQEDIYKKLAEIFIEDNNANEFIKDLKKREQYVSGARKNKIVSLTTLSYPMEKPVVCILMNKQAISWRNQQAQFFVFYHYGEADFNTIYAMNFLIESFKKKTLEELYQLLEMNEPGMLEKLKNAS